MYKQKTVNKFVFPFFTITALKFKLNHQAILITKMKQKKQLLCLYLLFSITLSAIQTERADPLATHAMCNTHELIRV